MIKFIKTHDTLAGRNLNCITFCHKIAYRIDTTHCNTVLYKNLNTNVLVSKNINVYLYMFVWAYPFIDKRKQNVQLNYISDRQTYNLTEQNYKMKYINGSIKIDVKHTKRHQVW